MAPLILKRVPSTVTLVAATNPAGGASAGPTRCSPTGLVGSAHDATSTAASSALGTGPRIFTDRTADMCWPPFITVRLQGAWRRIPVATSGELRGLPLAATGW